MRSRETDIFFDNLRRQHRDRGSPPPSTPLTRIRPTTEGSTHTPDRTRRRRILNDDHPDITLRPPLPIFTDPPEMRSVHGLDEHQISYLITTFRKTVSDSLPDDVSFFYPTQTGLQTISDGVLFSLPRIPDDYMYQTMIPLSVSKFTAKYKTLETTIFFSNLSIPPLAPYDVWMGVVPLTFNIINVEHNFNVLLQEVKNNIMFYDFVGDKDFIKSIVDSVLTEAKTKKGGIDSEERLFGSFHFPKIISYMKKYAFNFAIYARASNVELLNQISRARKGTAHYVKTMTEGRSIHKIKPVDLSYMTNIDKFNDEPSSSFSSFTSPSLECEEDEICFSSIKEQHHIAKSVGIDHTMFEW